MRKEALDLYHTFKALPGSEHIAKPVSLSALLEICEEVKPRRILELGGGIGAISYIVLKNSNAHVDIYEDNRFCINALKKNLSPFTDRYTIITDYKKLPPSQDYDLVVIDGGDGAPKDGGYASSAGVFLRYLERVKVVYIEGYRGAQRSLARSVLRHKYICTLKRYKEIYRNGEKWHGGLRINCKRSTSSLRRFVHYWFWELLIRFRARILWYFKK